ncbi:site-specific integrase [Variovorax ureilyticus]|uniref:Site-specific integrase n=1 Tax=Variovorax ureilyticus TaxID=1836198 RepID=A0ABU8VIG7_9BURK
MTETKSKKKTPVINFTIKEIDAIEPPPHGQERLEFKDSKVPGLYLRVTPSGVKSFSFVGRAKGAARPERETIGRYPAVKPEEARTRATQLAGSLASGESVTAVRQAKKGEMTLTELWDHYATYSRTHSKKIEAFEEIWGAYLQPRWGSKRLSDIKPLDVERWHLSLPDEIMKRRAQRSAEVQARRESRRREVAERQAIRRHGPDPKKPIPPNGDLDKKNGITGRTAANRAVQLLRTLYNFAIDKKRRYFVGENPASGHALYESESRERFLQPDELGPFFMALADEPNETFRDFFTIALLTGVRRATVLGMKWSDISLTRAEWRTSGALQKNKKAQTVTLAPEAVQILEQRFEKQAGSQYVFPSDRTKAAKKGKDDHIREPHSAWSRILARAGLKDLHIHDLRRTLGSWQARTGSSLVLIGKSLNHQDPQSTAIYARLDLDPVRESVDRATSAMFEAAGLKPAAEVIQFPKPQASEPRAKASTTRRAK